MKVIIVGAGDMGQVAAETISEIHDVLLIEKDSDIAESVKGRLNVSVLHEDGTNPKSLRYAIETHHAEVIISTLNRDDSNLFICMMAKRFKPSIRTIASINNPDFMIETSEEGFDGVDILISPELITAEKMYRLAILENAVDYEYINHLRLSVAIFAVESEHRIVGSIVMNLPNNGNFSVFGIYRDDSLLLDVDTMEIHPGDRVCVIGDYEGISEFNQIVGVDDVAKEFVILGGSVVGKNLAKFLSTDPVKRYVKIIDKDPETCHELARTLSGIIVINADFTEPGVQSDENVFKSDCMFSTSRLDDTNLLMCMSAQKYNARKIVSRYFKKEYKDIFTYTGLESIIGYYKIVSSEITKCTISDEMAILRLKDYNELFFIHRIDTESKLLNKYYGDIAIPEGVRLVAIRRDDEIIYPRMDTPLLEGDSIIVFTNLTKESTLARVFGKNVVSEM